MTNNRPMIIGTADAIRLNKRMEMLETQISALLDGMNASREAVGALLAAVDDLEAKVGAIGSSIYYAPEDATIEHLSAAIIHRLEGNPELIKDWAEDLISQGKDQSEVVNG